MQIYKTSFTCLLLLSLTAISAQTLRLNNSIQIAENGNQLTLPFAGGLNQPQFSPIDLDQDGIDDLMVFDRAGNKVLTFINGGTNGTIDYQYAPEYEKYFPELSDWVLLRDYDGDGKADIFTSTLEINAVSVFRNTSNGQNLAFTKMAHDLKDKNTNWTIAVTAQDLPAFVDVDGDGDMDVLTFDSGGFHVQWFRNLSQEMHNHSDSLTYELAAGCWGNFMENGLNNTISLNVTCKSPGGVGQEIPSDVLGGGRHSGSTLCAFDLEYDGSQELLLGDLNHNNLVYLHNDGQPNLANMDHSEYYYPVMAPVNLEIFPAAFYMDVNNDGKNDLLVAPNGLNISANYGQVYYYQDKGNASQVNFSYEKKTFLLDEMIECGESASPVLFDYNGDGLLDLVIGNYRYKSSSTNERSAITVYQNSGTAGQPAFELATRDYLGLSSYFNPQEFGFSPAFGDLDGDMDLDMVLGTFNGELHYFENKAPTPSDSPRFQIQQIQMSGIDIGQNASPQLIDLDGDGLLDLLIGESNGNLNYFKNKGSKTVFQFDPNPDDSQFGGVEIPGRFSAYSAPRMVKNKLGDFELYVGGNSGRIFHYTDISINGTFTLADTLFGGLDLGERVYLDIADLNGDGNAEFVIGNKRGGIGIFDSLLTTTNVDARNHQSSPFDFTILSGNQSQERRLQFAGDQWKNAEVAVYSLDGKMLFQQHFKQYQKEIGLSLQLRSSGLYLLRVTFDSKYQLAKKLLIP